MGNSVPSSGRYTVEGMIRGSSGNYPGYVVVEDGYAVETGRGQPPYRPDMHADVVMGVVNAHTHCADYGLEVPPGMSLEQLVAPPDGLKHRYLREASEDTLISNISRFAIDSRGSGADTFVDFREGGEAGCRILRSVAPDALILGRPLSPEYDPEEMDRILSIADGIGIPSISDMPMRYIEDIADEVRSRCGILAIHASERIREDIDSVLSLDPAFIVHMCEATDSDLGKCAEAEVPVVVCPTSNMYFGKVPPIARMQDCGVDLALGTDNGMLCSPDMISELRVMMSVASSQGGDPEGCWSALTCLSSKLLNPHARMGIAEAADSLVICPEDGASPIVVRRNKR